MDYKIYLASTDPVITEGQAKTEACCQRIIALYKALPWWKRMNRKYHKITAEAILQAWTQFQEFMSKRITEQQLRKDGPNV